MRKETAALMTGSHNIWPESLIFISYIAGLCVRYKLPVGEAQGFIFSCPKLLFYLSLLALSFVAGSSILGLVILPVCSFSFGYGSYCQAERMLKAYFLAGHAEIKVLISALIIFPIFFVLSVQGMNTSKILINSLCSSSLAVKDSFNYRYIPMLCCLSLWTLAVFFIIG